VKAAGGAVTQRQDGIVVFDPAKLKGRRDLLDSCPYDALVWNDERDVPQNWFFDAHLLDAGWTAPRCVSVCPTRAITAVQLAPAAMAAKAAEEGLQVLKPELGTRPRVFYRHLGRVHTCFVAGSVTCLGAQGQVECLAGAQVRLSQGSREVGVARTDAFGDFRIDGLPPGSGRYLLVVTHPQWGAQSEEVNVGEHSVVLEDIALHA
jgi:ferredoxin